MRVKKVSWQPYLPDMSVAMPFLAGDTFVRRMLRLAAAKITTLDKGAKLLARGHHADLDAANCFTNIARECRLTITGEGNLPSGPLVVVANHPTGPMDGISYGKWLFDQRPDTLILTTDALAAIPCFRDKVIGLSLYGGASSARGNALALRRVMKHLSSGGCIAAFPAGTISWRHEDGIVRDPEWLPTVFELALRKGCPVACVQLHAHHERAMQRALALHPVARTFLLGRAFMKFIGGRHHVEMKDVLFHEADESAEQLAQRARQCVERGTAS